MQAISVPKNARFVADLAGWCCAIVTQPLYNWLTESDLLLYGGDTTTETDDGSATPNAGAEGMLYRRSLADPKTVPLTALSERLKAYEFRSNGEPSPDGHWLLSIGTRPLKRWNGTRYSDGKKLDRQYYWLATRLDGSQQIAWPIHIPDQYPKTIFSSRAWVNLSNTVWLPDSSGIIEFRIDRSESDQSPIRVTGQMHLLSAPTTVRPLPPVDCPLDAITGRFSWMNYAFDVRMTSVSEGKCIALYPRHPEEEFETGKPLMPDRIALFYWNWRTESHQTVQAHIRIFTFPPDCHLLDQKVSNHSDRILFALMDRKHYRVVGGSPDLPTGTPAGLVTFLLGRTDGSSRLHEIARIPVPTGQELWFNQRFGLGEWLPGDRSVSFQFGKMLYVLPV